MSLPRVSLWQSFGSLVISRNMHIKILKDKKILQKLTQFSLINQSKIEALLRLLLGKKSENVSKELIRSGFHSWKIGGFSPFWTPGSFSSLSKHTIHRYSRNWKNEKNACISDMYQVVLSQSACFWKNVLNFTAHTLHVSTWENELLLISYLFS